MNILIYDRNKENSLALKNIISAEPTCSVRLEEKPDRCMISAEAMPAFIVFIGVDGMGEELGELIRGLRNLKEPPMICLTGDRIEDSVYVYHYKCQGFLKSPYQKEEVEEVIETMNLLSSRRKKIEIRTFGNFDVFVNDRPILFRNAKAKELLAMCVDRKGGVIKSGDAIEELWPEREYDERTKRLYRKAVIYLHKTMEQYGIPTFFVTRRGMCRVNTDGVKCDYYDFLSDPKGMLYTLTGEYMKEYEWSETTLGSIIRIAQKVGTEEELEFLYR